MTLRHIALLAGFLPFAAFAGARQEAKVLMSENPTALQYEQEWDYDAAIVTGDTIYLSGVVAVKNRHVKAPFPAWTAIQVARLIPPNGITEIKGVAKLPATSPRG